MQLPLFLTIPRAPDFVIGEPDAIYLRRWWVIPRNRWFNIYLHHFCRSDDDRALHDHPWAFNCSILLRGNYREVMPAWMPLYRGHIGVTPTREPRRRRWLPYFRWGFSPHRLELIEGAPVWTLFITGPIVRDWGFRCPSGEWRHWKEFVTVREGGNKVGPGCE